MDIFDIPLLDYVLCCFIKNLTVIKLRKKNYTKFVTYTKYKPWNLFALGLIDLLSYFNWRWKFRKWNFINFWSDNVVSIGKCMLIFNKSLNSLSFRLWGTKSWINLRWWTFRLGKWVFKANLSIPEPDLLLIYESYSYILHFAFWWST